MNYELEIQKSNPVAFYNLNGTKPPLVAGAGSSTLYTTAGTSFTFPAFQKNYESSPFSYEVWFLPISSSGSGELVVAGHAGEGLLYDGTDFILRANFVTAGPVEARWTPSQPESFYFVVVYDTQQMILYANEDRVAVIDVPAGDKFVNTTASLVIHGGITSTSAIYDALALYYRILPANEIAAHHAWGLDVVPSSQISVTRGGSAFSLLYQNVDVLSSYDFDLSLGHMVGVSFGTQLVSDDSSGGSWSTTIPLAAVAGSTTAGVHLEYAGNGVTLQYSTNGTVWTTVGNKRTVLEDAASPTLLYLKLLLADDASFVDSFKADVLRTRTMGALHGSRTLSFKGATMDETAGNQLEYQSDQGAQIVGGYLDIGADPNTTNIQNVAAIEAWIKFDQLADGWVIDISGTQFAQIFAGTILFSGMTMYRDGVSVASGQPFVPGEWHHYVFALTTPVNVTARIADRLIGGSPTAMTVGTLAIYSSAVSAPVAQAIYKANIGAPLIRIDSAGTINVSESSPAIDIYAYTWSIVRAGR
jgi:hypothetical protein